AVLARLARVRNLPSPNGRAMSKVALATSMPMICICLSPRVNHDQGPPGLPLSVQAHATGGPKIPFKLGAVTGSGVPNLRRKLAGFRAGTASSEPPGSPGKFARSGQTSRHKGGSGPVLRGSAVDQGAGG